MKTHRIYVNNQWYSACAECGELELECTCLNKITRGENVGTSKEYKEVRKKNR